MAKLFKIMQNIKIKTAIYILEKRLRFLDEIKMARSIIISFDIIAFGIYIEIRME